MKTNTLIITIVLLFFTKIGHSQDIDSMVVQFIADFESKAVYNTCVIKPSKDSVWSSLDHQYSGSKPCAYYKKGHQKNLYHFSITRYMDGDVEMMVYFPHQLNGTWIQFIFSLKQGKIEQAGFIYDKGNDESQAYNLRRSGLFQRKIATTSGKGYLDKEIGVDEFTAQFMLITAQANLCPAKEKQPIDVVLEEFMNEFTAHALYDTVYRNVPPKDSTWSVQHHQYIGLFEPCSYYAEGFKEGKYRFELTQYASGETEIILILTDTNSMWVQSAFTFDKNNKVQTLEFTMYGDDESYRYCFQRAELLQPQKVYKRERKDETRSVADITVNEFIQQFNIVFNQANL